MYIKLLKLLKNFGGTIKNFAEIVINNIIKINPKSTDENISV